MFFKRKGIVKIGKIPKELNLKTLNMIEELEWDFNNQRQKTYKPHKDTKSIILRFKPKWVLDLEGANCYDGESYQLEYYPLFYKYKHLVSEYLNILSKTYEISDYGCMIVKLKPNGLISPHIDVGNYFTNCCRIHIPLKTSNKVKFYFDKKETKMKVGNFYQIDNTKISHSVHNDGDIDRIHIIFDLFKSY
jgi:hypothetical protein